ncbi:isochorismatase [Biscogniauxia mediterranea]|nr:isochorismatase [Biscogniauxia mediterranea]
MAKELAFGPPGDEWVFKRESKIYDLTRGRPQSSLSVQTTHGLPGVSFTLAPALSVLVVVDMQNFFLHPNCYDHPTGLAAVDKTIEVVKKCREAGIKIIWLNWGLTEEDIVSMPAATQRSFSRSLITPSPDEKQRRDGFGSDMGEGRGRLLMAGSWNADIYGPLKEISLPEDIFCDKNRISGLWHGETPLGKALVAHGIRTLLFAGVNTDQCVLGTLSDAYYQGFDCIMVEDCCGTPTPGGQDVSIYNTAKVFGFVVNSKSFCEGQVKI